VASSTRIKTGGEEAVRVEGLTQLVARLKALETGAEVGVRLANKAAAQLVASGAVSAASSLGGVAAHVAPSIKASAGLKSGSVSFGGGDFPMAAGAEFGGQGRSTTQQFSPWTGTTGRFVFPTIRRDQAEIDSTYRAALDRIIQEAGLA
jgi:hypothetical protein